MGSGIKTPPPPKSPGFGTDMDPATIQKLVALMQMLNLQGLGQDPNAPKKGTIGFPLDQFATFGPDALDSFKNSGEGNRGFSGGGITFAPGSPFPLDDKQRLAQRMFAGTGALNNIVRALRAAQAGREEEVQQRRPAGSTPHSMPGVEFPITPGGADPRDRPGR